MPSSVMMLECGSTQHLILFISQGLGRCYDNTVSGVNADRVDVLHVADGDAVSYAVPHYLVLSISFHPAIHLSTSTSADTGKTESVREDLDQLFFVVSDTAAASAEGVKPDAVQPDKPILLVKSIPACTSWTTRDAATGSPIFPWYL